jgi:hypothetical protein
MDPMANRKFACPLGVIGTHGVEQDNGCGCCSFIVPDEFRPDAAVKRKE